MKAEGLGTSCWAREDTVPARRVRPEGHGRGDAGDAGHLLGAHWLRKAQASRRGEAEHRFTLAVAVTYSRPKYFS